MGRREWQGLFAAAFLGLLACAARSHAADPEETPEAEMLKDLDFFRESDLARERELLTHARFLERLRLLEALRLLESQMPIAPAPKEVK